MSVVIVNTRVEGGHDGRTHLLLMVLISHCMMQGRRWPHRGHAHIAASAVVSLLIVGLGMCGGTVEGKIPCSCVYLGCSDVLSANSTGHDPRCSPACMIPGAIVGLQDNVLDSSPEIGCCPDFSSSCSPSTHHSDDFAGKSVNVGSVSPTFTVTIASAPAHVIWPAQDQGGSHSTALFSLHVAVKSSSWPRVQMGGEDARPLLVVASLQGGGSGTHTHTHTHTHTQTHTLSRPVRRVQPFDF